MVDYGVVTGVSVTTAGIGVSVTNGAVVEVGTACWVRAGPLHLRSASVYFACIVLFSWIVTEPP